MIFIDTGYLWALVDRRDELHVHAVAWHRVVSEPLITTEYVLWELINGFSVGEDRSKAHAVVDEIRGNSAWKLIAASPTLFEAGFALHRQVVVIDRLHFVRRHARSWYSAHTCLRPAL
jgi:predicted nucleic acid-binding protein